MSFFLSYYFAHHPISIVFNQGNVSRVHNKSIIFLCCARLQEKEIQNWWVSSIAKTAFAGSFASLSLKSLKPLNFLDKVELSFP